MNILWITLESIFPADSGGRLGVFKRLEQITRTENVFLFYSYDDPSELIYKEVLEKYCTEVHAYPRRRGKLLLKDLCKYPYTVASRRIPEMQQEITECLENKKIDLINVDFPHMCVNLLGCKENIPIVLNEHNIEWKVYRMIANSQHNIFKKTAYWLDSYRLKRYEKKILKILNIRLLTFVSSEDMREMKKIENAIPCKLVPVGADLKKNIAVAGYDRKEHNIIFVGKMSYSPNIEAAEWFTKKILSKILIAYPNVKFYIVGKNPDKRVKRLNNLHVIVTGKVDNVDIYYQQADLVVIPLKNGGGVKVKLLEALSFHKEIVSTSKGVEGTLYADGKTIPVSNDEEEFAEYCIQSLNKTEEMKKRQQTAYEIFKHNYTWEKIGLQYKEYLYQTINNGRV